MKTQCIICPRGCSLTLVQKDAQWEVFGAACRRGVDYGIEEATAPRRMLTTTMEVEDGVRARVSVRSSQALPKEILFPVLESLRGKKVPAPIEPGQIVVENVGGTEMSLIATSRVERKTE